MIHSRTLTFDESNNARLCVVVCVRVSADVTAVRAMRNGSDDPSSYFKAPLSLLSFLSFLSLPPPPPLIRLQSLGTAVVAAHRNVRATRSALRGIISDPAAEDGRAERRERRAEMPMRGHLLHFYACAHVRWLKAHYYYCSEL